MMGRIFPGVAVLATLLLSPYAASGAVIYMEPSSPNIPLGSALELRILASGVNLGGFDFVLGFNPALTSLVDVSPDLFLGDPLLFEAFFNVSPGLDTVQISEVSLLDPATLTALQGDPPGNVYRLATLTFQSNAPGIAEFTYGPSIFTDPDAAMVTPDLSPLSVTIVDDSAAVPESATWRLVTGFGWILAGRLIRRAASKLRITQQWGGSPDPQPDPPVGQLTFTPAPSGIARQSPPPEPGSTSHSPAM